MSYSHTLTYSVGSTSGASNLNGSGNETGNTEILINTQFPAASTNVSYTLAFAYTALQSILLVSDKGMTLKFNSTGSPTPTITLQPGIPFVWETSSGYFANPFTANVTVLYVSCTPASKLQGRILTT